MSSGRVLSGGTTIGKTAIPVVQILPEGPVARRRLEIPVRGCDHPDVDPDVRRAAHPADLALLQYPQQLGLHGGGHLADFVKQQSAPVSLLEVPRFSAPAPR